MNILSVNNIPQLLYNCAVSYAVVSTVTEHWRLNETSKTNTTAGRVTDVKSSSSSSLQNSTTSGSSGDTRVVQTDCQSSLSFQHPPLLPDGRSVCGVTWVSPTKRHRIFMSKWLFPYITCAISPSVVFTVLSIGVYIFTTVFAGHWSHPGWLADVTSDIQKSRTGHGVIVISSCLVCLEHIVVCDVSTSSTYYAFL